jgi:hypothetical protein
MYCLSLARNRCVWFPDLVCIESPLPLTGKFTPFEDFNRTGGGHAQRAPQRPPQDLANEHEPARDLRRRHTAPGDRCLNPPPPLHSTWRPSLVRVAGASPPPPPPSHKT